MVDSQQASLTFSLGVLVFQARGGAKDMKFEVPKTAIAGTVKIVNVKAIAADNEPSYLVRTKAYGG